MSQITLPCILCKGDKNTSNIKTYFVSLPTYDLLISTGDKIDTLCILQLGTRITAHEIALFACNGYRIFSLKRVPAPAFAVLQLGLSVVEAVSHLKYHTSVRQGHFELP